MHSKAIFFMALLLVFCSIAVQAQEGILIQDTQNESMHAHDKEHSEQRIIKSVCLGSVVGFSFGLISRMLAAYSNNYFNNENATASTLLIPMAPIELWMLSSRSTLEKNDDKNIIIRSVSALLVMGVCAVDPFGFFEKFPISYKSCS